MSSTVLTDSIAVNAAAATAAVVAETLAAAAAMEVEFAKCDCCGLTEECTPAYIERIRERYQGKWICGLCAEAVKDETARCERLISAEEALSRHINFCMKFRSLAGPPPDPTVHLIAAVRRILRRRLEPASMPSSPVNGGGEIGGAAAAFKRSESCIATLSLVNRSVEMQQSCE